MEIALLFQSSSVMRKRQHSRQNLQTPLHFAAQEYRVEIAQLLLKHGAQWTRETLTEYPLAKAVLVPRTR